MKQKTKNISISKKLIFMMSTTAIIAILLSSTAFFINYYITAKDEQLRSIENLQKILSQNLVASIDFGDKESAFNLLKTLHLDKSIDKATIYTLDGEVFSSYTQQGIEVERIDKKVVSLYSSQTKNERMVYNDFESMILIAPILSDGEPVASFAIATNKNSFNEAIENEFYILLSTSLVVVVLIILIAQKLQKIFTNPIYKLKNAMEKVGEKDYSQIIESNSNDEFAILFDGFNKMITTIQEQNEELSQQKEFVQTLLDSQEQLVITTDGTNLYSVNETFLDFFAVDSIDDFKATYGACICETFSTEAPEGYIQKTMHDQSWIDYVISNAYSKLPRKVLITRDEQKFIFSVSGAQLPGEKRLKSAVFTDITEVENAKQNIIDIHKHTKESIEYAALIQGALIPNYSSFQSYFDDYFAIWHPKDTVGGDIYLFEELRNEDECILMVIDCTGHGVPGAFVTMLVKAIERQINAKIKHGDEIVSPGKLLSVFNSSMKHLLRQEKIDSISNAGFDGAILYYNKRENIIKFAGAETPLFYVEDGELKMIKGSRHSVGYKKSDINYEFKEHIIPVTKGMQFYITTDGYVDQTGGEKGFSFGKKRFQELIENYKNESMADQQEAFLYALADYQDNYERNDDITVIGLKI